MADTCDDPEVHALGTMVVSFSVLEFALETSIWELMDSAGPQKSVLIQSLTSHIPFRQKVETLTALFRLKYRDEAKDELRDVAKKLEDVNTERNALIHSLWYRSCDSDALTQIRTRRDKQKGFERRVWAKTAADIQAVDDRIGVAFTALARFSLKHIQEPIRKPEES